MWVSRRPLATPRSWNGESRERRRNGWSYELLWVPIPAGEGSVEGATRVACAAKAYAIGGRSCGSSAGFGGADSAKALVTDTILTPLGT